MLERGAYSHGGGAGAVAAAANISIDGCGVQQIPYYYAVLYMQSVLITCHGHTRFIRTENSVLDGVGFYFRVSGGGQHSVLLGTVPSRTGRLARSGQGALAARSFIK